MPTEAHGACYDVVHETSYEYKVSVAASRQLAHLKPRETPWQRLIAHRLEIAPATSELGDDVDYFGNPIVRFAVDQPHRTLTVRSSSCVVVQSHVPPANAESCAWEEATEPIFRSEAADYRERAEYRVASPKAPILRAAADYARPSFTPGRPWLDALRDLTCRIQRDFVYDPAATEVTTPVVEVLQLRRGVCQDFAHLMISALRSLGLPARYVSGYILNVPPPGKTTLTGADASHAWVAAHCPVLGWVGFDPTNDKLADIEFITVAWGRDFSDVTPLRGVVLGGGEHDLDVRVSVKRHERETEDASREA